MIHSCLLYTSTATYPDGHVETLFTPLAPYETPEALDRICAEYNRVIAVSYTHLDVYKRQGQGHALLLTAGELVTAGIGLIQNAYLVQTL